MLREAVALAQGQSVDITHAGVSEQDYLCKPRTDFV